MSVAGKTYPTGCEARRSVITQPVILEGDDPQALYAEAVELAAAWMGGSPKVLAGLHVDVNTLDLGPDAMIKVDDVRTIRKDAILRPFDGETKVYIVAYAHNMNVNAQNALLKLLEEPPPHARFVLLTQNAGKLLPTVRSRCRLEAGVRTVLRQPDNSGESERAHAFVNALDDQWERMRIAYSWEKLPRETVKNVLHAVLVCLRDRSLREGAVFNDTIDIISNLLPALEQNASVGSVCGVLAVLPVSEKNADKALAESETDEE